MPILGTIASSYRALTVSGAMEPIAVATVPSSGLSQIIFGSIPQTYTHLQLRFIARNTVNNQNLIMWANNDTTGTNYRTHYISGDGTSIGASQYQLSNYGLSIGDGTGGAQSNYAVGIVDILDYTNTNKNKVTRTLNGRDTNGSGNVYFMSALWLNTAAITSLTIQFVTYNIEQYSSFALYGIKGA